MKKFYLMIFVAFSIAISSCDNQAKQREIEKQRQEDSIRVAENVKKELAKRKPSVKSGRLKNVPKEKRKLGRVQVQYLNSKVN